MSRDPNFCLFLFATFCDAFCQHLIVPGTQWLQSVAPVPATHRWHCATNAVNSMLRCFGPAWRIHHDHQMMAFFQEGCFHACLLCILLLPSWGLPSFPQMLSQSQQCFRKVQLSQDGTRPPLCQSWTEDNWSVFRLLDSIPNLGKR